MSSPSPDAELDPGSKDPAPQDVSDIVAATSLSTGVLVLLVIIWSIFGPKLSRRSKYIGEGSAACWLGLFTGLILLAFHHYLQKGIIQQLLEFNAAGFFTYLLPPVIFYCGLSVEKKRFFVTLPSILLYGIFGTLISAAIISMFLYSFSGLHLFSLEDCLALGAIFAGTDSVATLQVLDPERMPLLFSLVFGEGVINDATAIVLLGAIARSTPGSGGSAKSIASLLWNFTYLFTGSLCLGSASGLGIAFTLKQLKCHGPHQEVALVGLLAYASYLLAEVVGLSGILALFCCGIAVSHYALHNISRAGQLTTENAFRTLSYVSEGMIFIYVGMDALDPLKWGSAYAGEAVWLTAVLMALLALSRAAFVVPFSLLHNLWSTEPLTSRDIVIIWWSGLMRGAVSVALVYFHFDDNPNKVVDRHRATLIVTTLMVVILSTLGYGAITKPLLAAMLRDKDRPLLQQLRTMSLPGLGGRAAGGSSGRAPAAERRGGSAAAHRADGATAGNGLMGFFLGSKRGGGDVGDLDLALTTRDEQCLARSSASSSDVQHQPQPQEQLVNPYAVAEAGGGTAALHAHQHTALLVPAVHGDGDSGADDVTPSYAADARRQGTGSSPRKAGKRPPGQHNVGGGDDEGDDDTPDERAPLVAHTPFFSGAADALQMEQAVGNSAGPAEGQGWVSSMVAEAWLQFDVSYMQPLFGGPSAGSAGRYRHRGRHRFAVDED